MADLNRDGRTAVVLAAAGLVLGAAAASQVGSLRGAAEGGGRLPDRGEAAGDHTIWYSALGFLAPADSSLSLEKGRSGNTVTFTTARVGDFQWAMLPLAVPSNVRVKKVLVCYRVSNGRSFVSQVRLAEETVPPAAAVIHDDGTDLTSTAGVCHESPVVAQRVNGAVTLSLRLNFADAADSVSVGAVGLVVGP